MTDAVDRLLAAEVLRDEGCRLKAYPDPYSPRAKEMRRLKISDASDPRVKALSGAPWTIGAGHTGPEVHEGLEWTQAQADAALAADLALHNALLARVAPWTSTLDPVRRRVLQNMVFNLGWDNPKTPKLEGLSGFQHFLAAVRAGQWKAAVAEMVSSAWHVQTGARAIRLERMMLTGQAA